MKRIFFMMMVAMGFSGTLLALDTAVSFRDKQSKKGSKKKHCSDSSVVTQNNDYEKFGEGQKDACEGLRRNSVPANLERRHAEPDIFSRELMEKYQISAEQQKDLLERIKEVNENGLEGCEGKAERVTEEGVDKF